MWSWSTVRRWDLGQWILALGGLGLYSSFFMLINGEERSAAQEDPVGWAVITGVSLLLTLAGFICHLVIRRRRARVQPRPDLPR